MPGSSGQIDSPNINSFVVGVGADTKKSKAKASKPEEPPATKPEDVGSSAAAVGQVAASPADDKDTDKGKASTSK